MVIEYKVWLQVALRNFYKRRRPVYGREPLVMKNLIGGKVKFQHVINNLDLEMCLSLKRKVNLMSIATESNPEEFI